MEEEKSRAPEARSWPKFYQGMASMQRMAGSQNDFQRTFLATSLFPKKREMQFDRHWIKVGIRRRPSDPDYRPGENSFMLNIREPVRILVLGKTGSGKTMMLRRMADTLYHSGYSCIFLSDIKDEMKSSRNPAPERQARALDEDEYPKALPVKVYRPLFFNKFNGERTPKDNYPLCLAYRDVKISELLLLLGFDSDTKKNQRDIISNHYKEAKSLEHLRSIIDTKVGRGQQSIKDSILRSLDPLIQFQVLREEPVGNIVEDIAGGLVPVLNVEGYDDIDIGSASIPQFYMTVILRLLVEAKARKEITSRVFIFIDEASDFLIPDTLLYKRILKAVRRLRQKGFFIVLATQMSDDIPELVISQARYTFVPFNITPNEIMRVLAFNGYFKYHPDDKQIVADRVRRLRMDAATGRRQWIFLDSNKEFGDSNDKLTSIFWALPALSAHMEAA